jgi:2-polyprenyl-3-methyl-5-hydroxy-6-metoxy-1,4-benzoquinol methylase
MSRPVSIPFSCPICSSNDGRWAAEHRGLHVARCAACGHGYVWPTPTPAFLDAIYSDNEYYRGSDSSIGFRDYASLESARTRMYTRHLMRIEAESPRGRILDVGCATGDFLKVARARGWEVLGADPSVARADVEKAGIKLVGRTVHDAEVNKRSLDAITFWDVLEHVTDPVSDLTRAGQLLRPGGVLALTVPDSANLVARMAGKRWFGYKTAGEHLQFFTEASLRIAFEKARLTLRTRRPTPWSCTLGFLADRAGLYLGGPGKLARSMLSRPRLSVVVVDVPQINQFALGVATAVADPVTSVASR